jgi:tetratricopeptide (TPR) repeat protein
MSHWYPLWYSPSPAALTVLPARELLADLLLELNQLAAALTEYKAVLQTDPNRFRSLLGEARAAKQAGDLTTAQNAYKKLVTLSKPSGPRAPRTGRGQSLFDQLIGADPDQKSAKTIPVAPRSRSLKSGL